MQNVFCDSYQKGKCHADSSLAFGYPDSADHSDSIAALEKSAAPNGSGTISRLRNWSSGSGIFRRRRPMKLKIAASAILLIAFAAPSFAQTTTTTSTTYYVAQDIKTKKCTIVDQKPADTTTMTILSDGAVFKTRTEAEGAMKSVKVCTTTN
jgi:hypothetical protein